MGRSIGLWGLVGAIALGATGCEDLLAGLPAFPLLALPIRNTNTPLQAAQSATAAQVETQVRNRINQVRQSNGLKPLQNNEKLAQVARNYSRQMAEKNFFSHTGPDGSTLEKRVRSAGIAYWVVGENLFRSNHIAQPAPVAVEGWMDSPGHRENILRPVFTETGVGVWREGSRYYITQLFLRR